MTMREHLASRIRGISPEGGMTIVEVVVASLVLALGAMATFGMLTSATKNTQRAKATQVALNRAQMELETLRSLENRQLAMTAAPPSSTNPLEPNHRVLNGTFALSREPLGDYANMVVNGGGKYGGGYVEGGIVAPGPTPFTSGDVSGELYRYVVWRDDTGCPAATCPGTQDYKQIIVAVKLDKASNQSGERGYVEVVSDFVDPTDSALNDPIPGSSGVISGQQFYLSDTPCSVSGTTAREAIVADHLVHNTLGICADESQFESEAGAPDALLLGVPPDPDYLDENNPSFYDYSNDIYLEPAVAETDKGLQLLKDDASGCNYTPLGQTFQESKVHRWVTDPFAEPFTMVEEVTLEFYTRTLNNLAHSGQLCIFIYKRHESGEPLAATDTFLTNSSTGKPYWTYNPGGAGWWRDKWTKIRQTLTFEGSPYTIPAGDRLGIALSVERSNTSGDALAIMYDHPKYPTRLEVDTNTPLDGS
jgi:type II secretory pathway pseudopilin PulG